MRTTVFLFDFNLCILFISIVFASFLSHNALSDGSSCFRQLNYLHTASYLSRNHSTASITARQSVVVFVIIGTSQSPPPSTATNDCSHKMPFDVSHISLYCTKIIQHTPINLILYKTSNFLINFTHTFHGIDSCRLFYNFNSMFTTPVVSLEHTLHVHAP